MTARPEPASGRDRVFRASVPHDTEAIAALLSAAGLPAPSGSGTRAAVCEVAGRVAGVLEWRDLGEEIEILELAVDPRLRRRGHAAFLLASFLRQTVDALRRAAHLEVRASNAAAIALYARFGFLPRGRRRGYYHAPEEDALLMLRPAQG